jgi:hypothetical protein
MIKTKLPQIIKNLFSDSDYNKLYSYLFNKPKEQKDYSPGFGRYAFNDLLIDEYSNKILLKARQIFNSNTLLPSYSLFSHYEGKESSLYKHKDDNACTYTIDMCVYQNQPWDLWVEDKNYTLYPNEALAYYGNDQLHWRDSFPNSDSQYVAMIFFHFVEPDHWWYTKGSDYINVIRNQITEEDWLLQRK